jgi:hypothetical protein
MALTIRATVFWDISSYNLVDKEHGVNINPRTVILTPSLYGRKYQLNKVCYSFVPETL